MKLCDGEGGLAGRVLGSFTLLEPLGAGAHAEVWRAVQPGLGRAVAVKLLQGRHAASSAFLQRFLREARLTARLRSPVFPVVFDASVDPDGTPWIAMELVDGLTLKDEVARTGPLPAARWWPVFAALAEALQQAHDLGIVHRDLSPGNVMIRADGAPVILDLGIARCAQELVEPGRFGTGAGCAMGTPGFSAPEQWEDATSAGPAADQYGLARLALYALSGRMPGRLGLREHLRRHELDLPGPILAVLARAEADLPADRFPDVRSFAAAVAAVRPVAVPAEARPAASFAAGDALADLREPSAARLHERTAGDEGWAAGELERARRCRYLELDGQGDWRIDAGGLFAWRLDAPRGPPRGVERVPGLGAEATRLLGLLVQAGGELDPALVPGPLRGLEELEARRRVHRVPGSGALVVAPGTRAPAPWDEAGVRELHRQILRGAEGAPGTAALRQAWRAALALGEPAAIGAATRRLVQALIERDGLGEATLALRVAAERGGPVEVLAPTWTDLVLAEPEPGGAARLRAWLGRQAGPVVEECRAMLDARERHAQGGPWVGPARAGDPRLALWALNYRVYAALREGHEVAEQVMAEAAAWHAACWDDPDIHAGVLVLRSFLHYRARRFAEAAALAFEAAFAARRLDRRVEARLAGAFALLEQGRWGAAAEVADLAREEAKSMYSPLRLGRATRAARDARWRGGGGLGPDAALADAALGLPPAYAAHHQLAEAAIAWRAGEGALSVRLAGRAARLYRQVGRGAAAALAEALALAAGPRVRAGRAAAILDAAELVQGRDDDLGLWIQAVGLVAPADPRRAGSLIARLSATYPAEQRGSSLEVLSVDAALRRASDELAPSPSTLVLAPGAP